MNNNQNIIETIVNFLHSINIIVVEQKLPNDTFLPGLSVLGNLILMDLDKLKYPGDLLHEAGHIAITEEKMRPLIGTPEIGDKWPTDGEEIAAILWSYAASCFLNLDLEIVFHPNGYKNDSKWIIEQFNNKNYLGLPLLEWMSLCNKEEFPKMKKWIR
ncbi:MULTISPECIES: hypothetical protein [Flavobacteriaceae]|uniref:ImmA/IrrE family metallo-endopeptidase n=2 Tax=Flavobacteriaceae TaxID=49546 RepID=A0A4Y8AWK5_9FLAO|nr:MULTISPECIES: hypothetical protein [Flavobacteriaceae]TEW76414.1 hypothetical protein E2488_00765 [Gramella jeungdoensis]